jgi:acyl carrier protein
MSDELIQRVTNVVAKIDSLDGINILFELENEFNLDIPDEATRSIRSVREMAEGIEKLLAAKQA